MHELLIVVLAVWVAGALAAKPNIVFIVADDMGWNDVSFHGAAQIPTPNIDALAYNGIILNKHYVLPICTPSRTALMTGQYPIRTGMQGFPLAPGEPRAIPLNVTLMPEYLRKLGYTTKLVGKWHVGYTTDNFTPARRGFDTFYGYYNGYMNYFNHTVSSESQVGNDLHRDGPESLTAVHSSEYFTDLVTDEAVKIIKSQENNKPLFLEISHLATHAANTHNLLEVRNMTETNEIFHYIKDTERRKYAGMMKAMDDSVGKIVEALSEANLLENSIIVFIADNGAPTMGFFGNQGSNYPLRGIKDTPYEGGIRSAACIFSPLIKAPSRVSNELMHVSDWLPTLYAAAGGNPADLQAPIDGVNQWPTLVAGVPTRRESLLADIDDLKGTETAIIGRFKLVRDPTVLNDEYYGESGNDRSYPVYLTEDALSSPAGSAIERLSDHVSPSPEKARKMRKESTLRCASRRKHSSCAGDCLFDLLGDPCETEDLSRHLPMITEGLRVFINSYRKYIIEHKNGKTDPCSYPKYFDGTWMPWRRANNILQSIVSDC